MDNYPQLFDRFGAGIGKDGAPSGIFNRYKINELRGSTLRRYEEYNKNIQFLMKKIQIPFLALIISACVTVFLIIALMNGVIEAGFQKAYSNAGFLFWAVLPLFIVTIATLFIFITRRKNIGYQINELTETEGKQIERLIISEINLPEKTETVFVLQRFMKEGKERPSMTICKAVELYSDNDNVYIYNDANLLRIPKRHCFSIEMVRARIAYTDISMIINYKSPDVKQYKIRQDDSGRYIVNDIGQITLHGDSGIFTIQVMPFCLDAVKKFFGKE